MKSLIIHILKIPGIAIAACFMLVIIVVALMCFSLAAGIVAVVGSVVFVVISVIAAMMIPAGWVINGVKGMAKRTK